MPMTTTFEASAASSSPPFQCWGWGVYVLRNKQRRRERAAGQRKRLTWRATRDHPHMTSTKVMNFLPPPSQSKFGKDIYFYKIQATALFCLLFRDPMPPKHLNSNILCGSPPSTHMDAEVEHDINRVTRHAQSPFAIFLSEADWYRFNLSVYVNNVERCKPFASLSSPATARFERFTMNASSMCKLKHRNYKRVSNL